MILIVGVHMEQLIRGLQNEIVFRLILLTHRLIYRGHSWSVDTRIIIISPI